MAINYYNSYYYDSYYYDSYYNLVRAEGLASRIEFQSFEPARQEDAAVPTRERLRPVYHYSPPEVVEEVFRETGRRDLYTTASYQARPYTILYYTMIYYTNLCYNRL